MSTDPLSDVLTLVGARCAITRGFDASGVWSLAMPAPNCLKLEAVVSGSAWLMIDTLEAPVLLQEGDVVVFDGHRPFTIAAEMSARPVDARLAFSASDEPIVRFGEATDLRTVVIGGHITVDPHCADLLLQSLPPLIHAPSSSAQASSLRWLLHSLLNEVTATEPASAAAVDCLAQLVLIHTMRCYLDTGPVSTGWLGGLADPRIGAALRMIHQAPGHDWQLRELARSAAMSRTAFATHFRQIVGVPPLTYLFQWRMRLAAHALRSAPTLVSQLASTLGYGSESSFSHAFKRAHGVGPRRYRQTHLGPSSPQAGSTRPARE